MLIKNIENSIVNIDISMYNLVMERQSYLNLINQYLRTHPIVAMLGPRQCGKTTLAKMYSSSTSTFDQQNYFDLEDPTDLQRLSTPKLTLDNLNGLIVIDEIQLNGDLFPILRVLVDKTQNNQKYLILGSASRELINKTSETLAGRIAYIEITPFSLVEAKEQPKLWLRGGFPKSYLAENNEDSWDWREFYITTFLERDIPKLGINIPSVMLRRFWTMIAHYHGQIFNYSELARSLNVSDATIRRYLDILSGTFMVRQLQPWWENIKKRQVKAPKVYIRDSGIFHSLLDIRSQYDLERHPKLGASWEGFALEEVIRAYKAKPHECFFWATHSGAELDLLIVRGSKKFGFEFKYGDAPKLTKSMKIAMEDLSLDSITVIYPGSVNYRLSENIFVNSLSNLELKMFGMEENL